MKLNISFSVLAVMAIVFSSVTNAAMMSQIAVGNAWVQAMPPSQNTSAAYMTIKNNSSKEAFLVSASSDIASAVELHHMSETGSMMNMSQVPYILVPAGGEATLQPGGYHIMLIGLKRPLHQGDIVPITLHFKDGSTVMVAAPVKMQQEQNPSGMPGMNM
jgi:periplasmic copper chaperone A